VYNFDWVVVCLVILNFVYLLQCSRILNIFIYMLWCCLKWWKRNPIQVMVSEVGWPQNPITIHFLNHSLFLCYNRKNALNTDMGICNLLYIYIYIQHVLKNLYLYVEFSRSHTNTVFNNELISHTILFGIFLEIICHLILLVFSYV
jgi:hypothetical protein